MNLQDLKNLEEMVIGTILTKSAAMATAVGHLRPEMFSNPQLATIYDTARNMFKNGEEIDLLSFKEALVKENRLEASGGIHYLVQLINDLETENKIDDSIRLLKETYLKRQLVSTLCALLTEAENETFSLKEALVETNLRIENITNDYLSPHRFNTMPAMMEQAITQAEKCPTPGMLTGIPTGIAQLDTLTSGWHPGQLILLATAPSTDKTSATLHLAKAAARAGHHTAVYSPDMPAEQLANRLLRSEAPFLGNGKASISEKEVEQTYTVARHLSELPLFINDSANIDMEQVHTSALIMQSKGKCNLIVINSLQQCEAGTTPQHPDHSQEIEQIMRSAKSVAMTLKIPVILVSQLKRGADKASDKPSLTDLQESIEQHSDIVMLLHHAPSQKADGCMIVAKHPNGKTGEIHFQYDE